MRDTQQKYISEKELKSHNKKDDLWISIEGKIYNVTSWINHHPGGDLPLLYFAGQDVTNVFLAYHPLYCSKYLDKFFTGYYLKDDKVSEISKDYRNLMSQFHKTGLFDNKGHGVLTLVLILAMMFSFSIYGVLFSNSFRVHLACGVLLGMFWIQLGWIGHDCSHYQVMITPKLNDFAQFVLSCFNGLSVAWWKRDHNAHHIACNFLEYDPNMQLMPIIATSPSFFTSLMSYFYNKKMNFDSLSRFLLKYQHWTFVLFLAFLRTYMFLESFLVLLFKQNVRNRGQDLVGVLTFWCWFTIIVSCLPNWSERVAFVAISIVVTGIQTLQFTLSHFPCDVYLGPPRGNNWCEKQIIGSLNIGCSPWMDWFHGGLQFQIEHHLFPRMPRCQLRNISPFVKEFCKKHCLPYNSVSFSEASILTFKTVKEAAFEARKVIY